MSVILSYYHPIILLSSIMLFCRIFILSVCHLVSLAACQFSSFSDCKLVSFSACASRSLRACFISSMSRQQRCILISTISLLYWIDMSKNIARVWNCPDIIILNSLFVLFGLLSIFLSFCQNLVFFVCFGVVFFVQTHSNAQEKFP